MDEEQYALLEEIFDCHQSQSTSWEDEGLTIVDGCMPTDIHDTNWDYNYEEL